MNKFDSSAHRLSSRRSDLDVVAILSPLPGADAAGPDLRIVPDSPFAAIEEARRQDDDLDQGVWVTDRKTADWNSVIDLCQDLLSTRSKDLRVTVWLAEALVQRDGFPAIAPAITLVEAFCRTFWPSLHPLIDEDGDMSGRTNAVAMLNSRLPRILRTKPITSSGFAEPVQLSWGDYENARLYQTRGAQHDGVSAASFQASADATPTPQLEALRHALEDGLRAVESLDQFLDDACRRDAPSLTAIKTLLGEILAWLHTTLPAPEAPPAPFLPPDLSPAGDETMPDEPQQIHSAIGTSAAGPIVNRDDAYRRLADVADYLMRAEPHSPAPYVLRRVLAWGRMPLHEVLLEMASGRNDLSAILEMLSFKE